MCGVDCLREANTEYATDIVDFIYSSEVPTDQTVAYVSFVCGHRLLKIELWRIHHVLGDNRLPYDTYTEPPASNLIETKILLNTKIADAEKRSKFF